MKITLLFTRLFPQPYFPSGPLLSRSSLILAVFLFFSLLCSLPSQLLPPFPSHDHIPCPFLRFFSVGDGHGFKNLSGPASNVVVELRRFVAWDRNAASGGAEQKEIERKMALSLSMGRSFASYLLSSSLKSNLRSIQCKNRLSFL